MARLFLSVGILGALCGLLPAPAPACSLCASTIRKETLGQEFDRAKLVFFGYAANPRLNPQSGTGATDIYLEKIIKNDKDLSDKKTVTVEHYLPVLDPKNPPHFLLFGAVVQGKWNLHAGRQAKGPAVIAYLEGAWAERSKGRVPVLLYYAKFLDHPDDLIADDAFLEFVRSNDDEVGQAAKHLSPQRLRTLLQNPKLDADRISLFAFLLGNCGGPADADFLRQRIAAARDEDTRALDGLLGGYIALRPQEGWKLTQEILGDHKASFIKRFAALRAVRFYQGWKPAETKPVMLAAFQPLIPDGEMADMAIEDLRRWQTWDLTGLILAQYGKPSHSVPIIKRNIIRYALDCPLPEAKRFVEGVRSRDAELIKELEEARVFERGK